MKQFAHGEVFSFRALLAGIFTVIMCGGTLFAAQAPDISAREYRCEQERELRRRRESEDARPAVRPQPEETPSAKMEYPVDGEPCFPKGTIRAVHEPKYVYDAKSGQYRSTETGRVVSPGELPWPKNNGFQESRTHVIQPGKILDRYGSNAGGYFGEPGTTISERGMVPGAENMPYARYEVLKPFEMETGSAVPVPEFGATGGAMQYRTEMSVQQRIDEGYIRRLP